MNAAITYNDLPKAEREVADLYAWGMTKKEIAIERCKSIRTIENQIRVLFSKSGVRKDTEFASWYFCTRFSISFDLYPLKKQIIAMALLILTCIGSLNETSFIRPCRSVRSTTSFRSFKRDNN
jgi:DNA-binding CsgD family transcriptional regulator